MSDSGPSSSPLLVSPPREGDLRLGLLELRPVRAALVAHVLVRLDYQDRLPLQAHRPGARPAVEPLVDGHRGEEDLLSREREEGERCAEAAREMGSHRVLVPKRGEPLSLGRWGTSRA